MKRGYIIFSAIVLLLALSACSKPPAPPVTAPAQTEAPPLEAVEQKPDYFELLREGRAENIDFGIGTKTQTIVDKWGKPEVEDYFLGGIFLTFGNITFFTDAADYSGKVAVIGISENTNVFGVRIGMTFDEIKKILGEPKYAVVTDADDELYGGDFCLAYESGEYKISFMANDEKSTTYAAYIEKKDNN